LVETQARSWRNWNPGASGALKGPGTKGLEGPRWGISGERAELDPGAQENKEIGKGKKPGP